MVSVQDTEVLALFEQEAVERLNSLSALLLELESDGSSDDLVARLFREAHTLKGAANVVGMAALGAEAHALEDLFDHVRTGTIPVTSELIDQMLAAVDRLGELSGIERDDATTPDAVREPDPVPVGAALAEQLTRVAPRSTDEPADPGPSTSVPPSPREREVSASTHETARVAVGRLDDIVRLAGESTAAHLRLTKLIADRFDADDDSVPEIRVLARLLKELQEVALRSRMLPVAAATPALRRAVRDVARRTSKQVTLDIRGEDTELDRVVHERLVDGLIHIVRNALDHGIESSEDRARAGKPEEGSIVVHAMQLGSRVVVTVSDDGAGVDLAAVRDRAREMGLDPDGPSERDLLELLFHPGFSTAAEVTDVSGRGVGLDAVRASLAELRGRVDVETTAGAGTVFRISVPITLTVLRALVVRAGGQRYAIPMSNVRSVIGSRTGVASVEGRPAVRVDRSVVAVTPLAELLGSGRAGEGPIVVVTGMSQSHAFCVDELEGERDVLLKNLPSPVPASDLVVGASAEPDGSVMLVLDAEALVEGATTHRSRPYVEAAESSAPEAGERVRSRILVVDDALTVRELQRIILERAGYVVSVAGDGRAALDVIDEARPDLVLTDVEMPELDGLGLVRAIREHERWSNVPVVVLTSRDDDEDRRAGLDAGADAYIVKSAFDEAALLDVVSRLLGVAS